MSLVAVTQHLTIRSVCKLVLESGCVFLCISSLLVLHHGTKKYVGIMSYLCWTTLTEFNMSIVHFALWTNRCYFDSFFLIESFWEQWWIIEIFQKHPLPCGHLWLCKPTGHVNGMTFAGMSQSRELMMGIMVGLLGSCSILENEATYYLCVM